MPEILTRNSPITLVEPAPTAFGRADEPLMPDSYTGINLPTRAAELLREILSGKGWTDVTVINPRYNETPGVLDKADWKQITRGPVLGLSFITRTAFQAREIALRYKAARKAMGLPGLVLAGGAHATFSVPECLEWADVVVRNEGDETLPKLLETVIKNGDWKGVSGISYKDKDMIVHEPDRPLLTERQLEELPWPNFDPRFRRGVSASSILTSRGCPYDCPFCSETLMNGGCYRRMKNEFALPRIRQLYQANPRDRIFFCDDNFAGRPKQAEDLLKLWIDEGLTDKRFMMQLHASIGLRRGFPDLVREAGVFLVALGLEADDDESLAALGKESSSARINYEGVRAFREAGVPVLGMFINGVGADNMEKLRKRREWAKQNVPLSQFFAPVPLPGTPFAKEMRDQGRVFTDDYYLYGGQDVVITPEAISPYDLQIALRDMNEDFFTNAIRQDHDRMFGPEVGRIITAYAMNSLRNHRRFYNHPQTRRYREFLKAVS